MKQTLWVIVVIALCLGGALHSCPHGTYPLRPARSNRSSQMINSPVNGRSAWRNAVFSFLFPALFLTLSLPLQSGNTFAQGAPKPLLPSLGAPKPLSPPAASRPDGTNNDTGAVEATLGLPPQKAMRGSLRPVLRSMPLTLSQERASEP